MTAVHETTQLSEAPEIWSIREIATFYRRSVRQASRIVQDISFPRPLRGDKHRWVAGEVIRYAVSSDHGPEGVLKQEKAAKDLRRIKRSSSMRRVEVRA